MTKGHDLTLVKEQTIWNVKKYGRVVVNTLTWHAGDLGSIPEPDML